MIKKLLLLFILSMIYVMPAKGQDVHVELDYHSFRPFIHFQLDFGSRPDRIYRSGYRSAYLKGYMDGVNDQRYYRHRFTDLVHDFRMYEAGYRDGFRDRALLIRLRGRNWYHRHRFVYDDYYAPAYSVRIWLSGLSLAFLQAPERRLPRRWRRRAHPRFKKYRRWYKKRRHYGDYDDDDYEDYEDYDEDDYDDDYEDDDDYRSYASLEKRYRNRVKRYERQARKVKKRYRQKASYKEKRSSQGRFKSRRSARKHIKKTNPKIRSKPV